MYVDFAKKENNNNNKVKVKCKNIESNRSLQICGSFQKQISIFQNIVFFFWTESCFFTLTLLFFP